jgi:hypothetical protein
METSIFGPRCQCKCCFHVFFRALISFRESGRCDELFLEPQDRRPAILGNSRRPGTRFVSNWTEATLQTSSEIERLPLSYGAFCTFSTPRRALCPHRCFAIATWRCSCRENLGRNLGNRPVIAAGAPRAAYRFNQPCVARDGSCHDRRMRCWNELIERTPNSLELALVRRPGFDHHGERAGWARPASAISSTAY